MHLHDMPEIRLLIQRFGAGPWLQDIDPFKHLEGLLAEGSYETACIFASELLKHQPNDPTLYLQRATAHLMLSEHELAFNDIERASRQNGPTDIGLELKGRLLAKQRQFKDALMCFDDTIGLNKNSPSAYTYRAFTHLELGNYDAALCDCFEAIKIDPLRPESYTAKALVHFSRREWDLAIETSMASITYGGDPSPANYNMAIAHCKAGRYDAAIHHCTLSLNFSPANYLAAFKRGYCQMKLERFEDATSSLDIAARLVMANETLLPIVSVYRALAYLAIGNTDDLTTTIRNLEQSPEMQTILIQARDRSQPIAAADAADRMESLDSPAVEYLLGHVHALFR